MFSDKKFYLQLKRWVWSQSQRRNCPTAGHSTPNNPITTTAKSNILTGPKDGSREISMPTSYATSISTVISLGSRSLSPNLIPNVFTRIRSVFFYLSRWPYIFCQGQGGRLWVWFPQSQLKEKVPLEKDEFHNLITEKEPLRHLCCGFGHKIIKLITR